ncbi:histidine phosphatase family protein [Marinomonas sp. THO17]|uniref:histidine phosphatase family protein n=1 Tax=Marinomonas sp. THO17 TaxID=3149048 RepID=UPI00336C1602
MKSAIRVRFLVVLLTVCLGSAAQADQSTWDTMAQPGVHALVRHALAPGMGDPANFQVDDCTTQRILDSRGRQQATQIGEALRQQGIRFDQVLSSQWCRCLETAELMKMGSVQVEPMLNSFFSRPGKSKAQTSALRAFLSSLPSDSKTLLVTHQVNITALTGIFPRSGEMVLVALSPDNNQLEVVGRLMPAPL